MNAVKWSAGSDRFTDHNNKGGAVQRLSLVPNINSSIILNSCCIVPEPSWQFCFYSPTFSSTSCLVDHSSGSLIAPFLKEKPAGLPLQALTVNNLCCYLGCKLLLRQLKYQS